MLNKISIAQGICSIKSGSSEFYSCIPFCMFPQDMIKCTVHIILCIFRPLGLKVVGAYVIRLNCLLPNSTRDGDKALRGILACQRVLN